MKAERQKRILSLITEQEIETQQELAASLHALGYKVTQATVSRDMNELHLIKIPRADGKYCYSAPDMQRHAVSERLIRILTDAFVSVNYAGNLVVVKTISGSANVAGEALDMLKWPEILGTIAGDNTIFIVTGDNAMASEVTERIRKIAEERD